MVSSKFGKTTAQNTAILPNFLVWKFCENCAFPQISTRRNYVKFRYFTQWTLVNFFFWIWEAFFLVTARLQPSRYRKNNSIFCLNGNFRYVKWVLVLIWVSEILLGTTVVGGYTQNRNQCSSTLLETFWQFLIDEFDLAVVETTIEHYFRKTWLKYD